MSPEAQAYAQERLAQLKAKAAARRAEKAARGRKPEILGEAVARELEKQKQRASVEELA